MVLNLPKNDLERHTPLTIFVIKENVSIIQNKITEICIKT